MTDKSLSYETIKETAVKLWQYCQKNNFTGYDPYDALNSRLLKIMPWAKSRLFRLSFTQGMKRLPINLRPLLMIPKTQNPKALAIFLKAALKLTESGVIDASEQISYLIKRIAELRSAGLPCYCWGYSFPWQTRTFLVPRSAPNLVCTVFVADALLDAYEATKNTQCLEMAKSAADYILNELYWSDNDSSGFSYPWPSNRVHIYNADFLGAALLSRISHLTGDKHFLEPALKVTRYAASKQNDDGSWYYGESTESKWIDNFHTGYNLLALKDISRYAETDEFKEPIKKGFGFYLANFFEKDGAPRYYHNKTCPIDIHCVAQSIITLEAFKDMDETNHQKAKTTLNWAMNNMWNKSGYFYYQIHRLYTNRISYMRWSQAWMLLALSSLIERADSIKNSNS